MTIKTLYIAKDGTTFTQKEKCENYEQQLNKRSIVMFDAYQRPTDDIRQAMYVNLNNLASVYRFRELSMIAGLSSFGITEAGFYVWTNRWVPVDQYIAILQAKIAQLNQMRKDAQHEQHS